MANPVIRSIRRASLSSLLNLSLPNPLTFRSVFHNPEPNFVPIRPNNRLFPSNSWRVFRNLSHGSVNLVISQGKPKFETHEIDPPKKEKWKTKKRLKQQRMGEKQKRKAANKRDPRRLGIKGKKGTKFANAEERIKYKLEKRSPLHYLVSERRTSLSTISFDSTRFENRMQLLKERVRSNNQVHLAINFPLTKEATKKLIEITEAKVKEGMLIERLKRYEVPKLQGPEVKPHELTGEERFYLKKMGQKGSNYVPVGRRGIFGGVILNMHMHWKKHETVKVICKPCKPGQIHEYADEIARLSGGVTIKILGDDTLIFYRGKDYVQPQVMSPIDTLSKKRALEKSKYEQSLESVRHFMAIAEKELELYYRHIALYGDPNSQNPSSKRGMEEPNKIQPSREGALLEAEVDFTDLVLSETEDDSLDEDLTVSESDFDDDNSSRNDIDSYDEEDESSSSIEVSSTNMVRSSLMCSIKLDADYRISK